MKKKKAIIFGITGQDGSYLARLLIIKGYKVFGVTRSGNNKNLINLIKLKIRNKITLKVNKSSSKNEIYQFIKKISPNEIYYLAGQSSVNISFNKPVETYVSNNLTLFYILEFCRFFNKKIKIYNSASSECFGNNKKIFCNEKTKFNPISPYGKAKSFGFWLVKYYRENFQLKASNGILFNHESPLRKKQFVTQEIINYANNYNKRKKKILLGNTRIRRDWGWANDYVEMMYKINSNKKNDDYVIGSGKHKSLLEFIKIIFEKKKIPLKMIKENRKFMRPNEIIKICSDNSKAKKEFNWKPRHSLETIALKLLKGELL
jgi:GDPmannose 4,6-dehydratase